MELNEILEESIKLMQEDFYKKKFYFSYSSLSKLLWNPQAFYQIYVLGNREERDDAHLVNGKIIHALLLEPEKFNQNFVIAPTSLPTGNTKKVVDTVFRHHSELKTNGDQRTELAEFEGAILDVMRDINYFQNLKTDQQRLDKVITSDTISYWGFLQTKGSKTLIDQESYDFCKNAVDLIKTDKEVCNLIGCDVTDFDNKEVYNELYLECQVTNKAFGLKGIIDNIVIDHDQKVISINDIKTTSKDLKDFPETVEFYNYWLQAVIYCTIVGVKFINLYEKGYKIKFNFVVIDKSYQVYAFPVSETTLGNWMEKLLGVIEKADWHYTNKDFTLPYEFATNKVIL
jgi:hypothetical protein